MNDTERPNQSLDTNESMFAAIIKFTKESTGISIALAYLTLILTSMGYLYILFDAFEISIIKFLSLEDILATPIKNPDIIMVFAAIILILFLTDLSNRFNQKQRKKYEGQKYPFLVKLFMYITWVPKRKDMKLLSIVLATIVTLVAYVIAFASIEADHIKEGKGTKMNLILAEDGKETLVTLLGTTTSFVFTYHMDTKSAEIYQIESIISMKPIVAIELEEKSK